MPSCDLSSAPNHLPFSSSSFFTQHTPHNALPFPSRPLLASATSHVSLAYPDFFPSHSFFHLLFLLYVHGPCACHGDSFLGRHFTHPTASYMCRYTDADKGGRGSFEKDGRRSLAKPRRTRRKKGMIRGEERERKSVEIG
jgi:hypothetical protein